MPVWPAPPRPVSSERARSGLETADMLVSIHEQHRVFDINIRVKTMGTIIEHQRMLHISIWLKACRPYSIRRWYTLASG